MNKSVRLRFLFTALGLVISTVPVGASILLYFPVWAERGSGEVLSGFSLLLLLMAAVPALKLGKRLLTSPSAPIMWLAAFVIFFMLSKIADDMTVICFVGFLSNLVGAFFFKLSDRYKDKRTVEDEG